MDGQHHIHAAVLDRQAPIGPNVTLYFEDRLTMRYQVQEMLRAERIFEAEAIAGQAERFDVYARLKHHDFPGGKLFRRPSLVMAMTWFRLKDLMP